MAEEPKPKRTFGGMEGLFQDELASLGARIDAFIFRPQQDWVKNQYFYRITLKDGQVKQGNIDWDAYTFSKILTMAKEG